MSDQFKYIKVNENDNFEVRLRPERIHEGSNPILKETLPIIDHPSRICAVKSIEELVLFTSEYQPFLNPGDLAMLIDTFSGLTKIFVWVNNTIRWQEVVLGGDGASHTNIEILNEFSEDAEGMLLYKGLPIQGVSGGGGTGDIQWKGVVNEVVDLIGLGTAEKGWLATVKKDENNSNLRISYMYDGDKWVNLSGQNFVTSSMEPSNKDMLWIDISDTSPVLKWFNGLTWVTIGGGGSSEATKKIQPFMPSTYYQYGEIIIYGGRIWTAKSSFTSDALFSESNWEILGGDMKRSIYDKDYDGIVDRAERADIADMALETALVQSWKPSTSYTAGQQLVYMGKIYTVKKNHVSPSVFNIGNLDLTATGIHNDLWELQGGEVVTNSYYHLSDKEYNVASRLKDSNGKLSYNSQLVGDMTKDIYDKNNNGIIDQAEKIAGMTITVTDLNSLQGIKGNVQSQLNSISHGMDFKGFVDTYADLIAYANPLKGYTLIVNADETQSSAKTFYTHDGTQWLYLGPFSVTVRDFKIDPLDLSSEVMNTLDESFIDSRIARASQVHTHNNFNLLETYDQSNSNISDAVIKRHTHLNKAILDSYNQTNIDITDAVSKKHGHINSAVLNNFSEDAFGELIYKGMPISSSGGSGGITDLSMFTTGDLKDSFNKRYVTDIEKGNLALLSGIIIDQSTTNNHISSINSKIPANASGSNKLVSTLDMTTKLDSIKFRDLLDVNPSPIPNSFVVMSADGSKVTYKADIKDLINIQKITDSEGTLFADVPFLKFTNLKGKILPNKSLELSPVSMFSTDLLDMPTTYADGQILVANSKLMRYEPKSLAELTDSKGNYTSIIYEAEWSEDFVNGGHLKIVEHNLDSKNLIVAMYDMSNLYISPEYQILNPNQILIKSKITGEFRIVINCSQGTINNGSGPGGGGGSVTTSDFLDDTRSRLDKTYSSKKITTLLTSYSLRDTTYSKAETDARFSMKGSEHAHTNLPVLSKFSTNLQGDILFNGIKLITNVTPFYYEKKWNSVQNDNLDVILDVAEIVNEQQYAAVDQSEILIRNIVPLTEDDAVNEINKLHIVVSDGSIIVLDVLINPEETQRYLLGISKNVKVMVKGNFNASYYLNAF